MQTHTGIIIALSIFISMLLICHTMNFIYPRKQHNINNFYNLPKITKSIPNTSHFTKNKTINIPTQYNLITYDNQLNKIPCDRHAQIPCNVIQEQCTNNNNTYQLSDSELAILYKEAYEMAGNEVLLRTLEEMQKTSTNPTTTTTTTTTLSN
jgi:hypothetical protein